MESQKHIVIQSDVSDSHISGLEKYIEMYCTSPKLRLIVESTFRKTYLRGETLFFWTQLSPDGQTSLNIALKIGKTIEADFKNLDPANASEVELYNRTLDLLRNLVWTYFQNVKKSSLYFVVGSEEEGHAEAPTKTSASQTILRRMFSGNSTNIFLLFLVLSYVVFLFVGNLTVVVIIGLQLVYLFYSDLISLNLGSVRPTADRPLVAVIGVRSSEEAVSFLRSQGKRILSEIRNEVSQIGLRAPDTTGEKINVDVKTPVLTILSKNGINVSAADVDVKTRDVYKVVQKVSKEFQRPVPKIVIGNSVVSNAMATGISAKRSSILITAGSLMDLDDDELSSVVGHELGHVKGHDPLILFLVTSIVYIGAFYLWFPLFQFLGLLYYFLAFGFIFAVGKVLETRADTESAVVLGNSKELAISLTKIGFMRLYLEKYSGLGRIVDWFSLDPHPPIYFRVSRLSKISGQEKRIRHMFLVSLRDCISGFFTSF